MKRYVSLLSLCSIALTIGLLVTAPLPSAAQVTSGIVRFHNTSFDSVTVEVRLGQTQADSIPYDVHTLKKGENFDVESSLPVFWRRELNPGTNDGKFTDWERVVPADDTKTVNLVSPS